MFKLLAILTMTIDHVNIVIYERAYDLLTHIGRFAFPLFVFFIVRNFLFYSKSYKKYLIRLIAFGVITQPIVMYVFGYELIKLNIFFTLAFGLILIYALEHKDYFTAYIIFGASFFVEYSLLSPILFLAIYYDLKSNSKISIFIVYIALTLLNFPYYLWSVPGVFIIYYLAKNTNDKPLHVKVPGMKYLFYFYYPTHLLLLEYLK